MSSQQSTPQIPHMVSAVLEHHTEDEEHGFGTIMSPRLRRCVSADTRRPDNSVFDNFIAWNRSENDHLSTMVVKQIERRHQMEKDFEREIYSSRSLFDSRLVPPPVPIPPPNSPAGAVSDQKRWKLQLLRYVRIVQHYFIPLQLGLLTALIWANIDYENYQSLWNPAGVHPHDFTFHFFINDIFMTLFFGIAMVHVSTALMSGGALYPIKRAITPILGTIGGVVGPAAIYLSLVAIEGRFSSQYMGWAVCIATDISIAWLTAVQVFQDGTHPAIQFLLLLAVVDDVIGLVVIAVAFPVVEMHLEWLGLIGGSIPVSYTHLTLPTKRIV